MLIDTNRVEQQMIAWAVREVDPGMTVNLGFGWPMKLIPTLMHVNNVLIHAENGVLGMGMVVSDPEMIDPDLINPAGEFASLVEGASIFDSSHSFAMIRRGKIDLAFLGALQVGRNGDLASWMVPGQRISGMGGGRELAIGARRVVVMMQHTDKQGNERLVEQCTYPLTASKVVDTLITTYGVFKRMDGAMQCIHEFAEGS